MKIKRNRLIISLILIFFWISIISVIYSNTLSVQSKNKQVLISPNSAGTYTGRYETQARIKDVFLSEGIAYILEEDYGLRCIDFTDILNPIEIGHYNFDESYASNIFIFEDIAYIPRANAGLICIDISNPFNPVEIVTLSNINTRKIIVSEDIAYFYDNSFRCVNIKDLFYPIEVGSYSSSSSSSIEDFYISGDIAIILFSQYSNQGKLEIVNISDPSSPFSIGYCSIPEDTRNLFVSGNMAYVFNGNGFSSIDISNPSNPVNIGFVKSTNYIQDMSILGNYAYIPTVYQVECVDISDPSYPIGIGIFKPPEFDSYGRNAFVHKIKISENIACLLTSNLGLMFLRISDIIKPYEIFNYNNLDTSYDVSISDGTAYIADGISGLITINITDPYNLNQLGLYNTPGTSYGVFTSNNLAYIADGATGLIILDISNPSDPIELGSYDTPGTSYNVFISRNIAYIADGTSGLISVDVTNPKIPIELAIHDTPGSSNDVFVKGKIAFVADGSSGLRIIDITDPSDPNEIGSYDTPGTSNGVYIYRNIAYIADGSSGLRIIDITDLSDPNEIGFYNTVGNAKDIFVFGNFAYVTDDIFGLTIIDVSDPSLPTKVKSYNTSGSSNGVFILNDVAYIADGTSGLICLKIFQSGSDDADGDGLTYIHELWTFNSNPNEKDTDWDGFIDGLDLYPTLFMFPTGIILIGVSILVIGVYIDIKNKNTYQNERNLGLNKKSESIKKKKKGNLESVQNAEEISTKKEILIKNINEFIKKCTNGSKFILIFLIIINIITGFLFFILPHKFLSLYSDYSIFYIYRLLVIIPLIFPIIFIKINHFRVKNRDVQPKFGIVVSFLIDLLLYESIIIYTDFSNNIFRITDGFPGWGATIIHTVVIFLLVFIILAGIKSIIAEIRIKILFNQFIIDINRPSSESMINNLFKLFKISNNVKIDSIAELMNMKRGEFIEFIVENYEILGDIKIKDDNLIINSDEGVNKFIRSLDQLFESWGKKEKKKIGKV